MVEKRVMTIHWRTLVPFIAALLIFGFASPRAYAQDDETKALAQLAALMKMSPQDPAYEQFVTQVHDRMKALHRGAFAGEPRIESAGEGGQFPFRDKPDLDLSSIKIVKHIKGEDGLPLTAAEPKIPDDYDGDEAARGSMQHFTEVMIAGAKDFARRPALPRCERSEVIRRDYPSDKGTVESLIPDVLFLRNVTPRDPDELFGIKVRIVTCTSAEGDACALAAEQLGLVCLPTRIRVHDGKLYRYQGEGALKNFDRAPGGVFHPLVKKNLRDYTGG